MPRLSDFFGYWSWRRCVLSACGVHSCAKIKAKCGSQFSVESLCPGSCSNRRLITTANQKIEFGKYKEALIDLDKAKKVAEENDNNNQLLEISSTKLNIYMNHIKDRKKALEELNDIRDYTKRLEAELRASDNRRNGTDSDSPPEVN